MSDAPAPAPNSTPREVSPGARKWLFAGIVIDLILTGCALLVGVLAQATSPTGQGGGLELLVALAILGGPPLIGWSLYNNTRVDVRWIMLLVWTPIVLLAIGIPLSIAYA